MSIWNSSRELAVRQQCPVFQGKQLIVRTTQQMEQTKEKEKEKIMMDHLALAVTR